MSSAEDECNDTENISGSAQGSKKRRIQRACDICRRKKSDGGQMPGNRCSNCIAYNFDCTYVEAAKKRGPPKGYVESLEIRLEKMDKLLHRLCPDGDFAKELGVRLDRESWPTDSGPRDMSSTAPSGPSPNIPSSSVSAMATSVIRGVGTPMVIADDLLPNDDDFGHVALVNKIKQLEINPAHCRFFGKSSGVMLIQTAIDLKNEYTGEDSIRHPTFTSKRPEFWDVSPWELSSEDCRPDYSFPDEDLIPRLIDYYFDKINLFMPLLHRPTFEKSVAAGLHKTDDMFGAVLLLVCAVGSRFSDDPRIFLEGADTQHSCGWKWFDQVQIVRRSLLAPPTLYDLQFYALSVQFLQGSSTPQACWTMVGVGIRLAQDVGAHRRKVFDHKLTVEDELWKRAFWVLVCIDRLISSALGRPCAIQDEDFDLDLPIECDDEYWETPDPEQAFKQPHNKPSVLAYFNCFLKLNQVLAFSLRTIYSINKSKILLGFVGQQWEQHIVAELDSALNKWIDSVPDHLRWDPTRENQEFFDQSASLYASYYHLQILIHRPFIPSPRKPSPLSFPSLAICTNAARSCSHVVDIQRKRGGISLAHTQMSVFTAGIVLLLNIWGGKRSGLSTDPTKEMADVHKCMQVLRVCERRWHSAGRLWDILCELASVGELPLPQPSPTSTNKRERDADSPIPTPPAAINTPPPSSSSTLSDGPRSFAGSRRVSSKEVPSHSIPALQQQLTQQQNIPPTFTLPMYSDELGRLPLHGQVHFSSQRQSPLDTPNNYWYSTLGSSGQVPSPTSGSSMQAGPATLMSTARSRENLSVPFPMDEHRFYGQMANNFSGPYGQQSQNAGPPQYHYGGDVHEPMQTMTERMHPRQQNLTSDRGPNKQAIVDSDTIAMWSTAPTGFELDDWGTYISSVSELTHGLVGGGGGPSGGYGQ